MSVRAVIEVTSYELSSYELSKCFRVPDNYKAVTLPLATPDGLPNHAQVLLLDMCDNEEYSHVELK